MQRIINFPKYANKLTANLNETVRIGVKIFEIIKILQFFYEENVSICCATLFDVEICPNTVANWRI